MNNSHQCIVIFPIYRSIDPIEHAFFKQSIQVTKNCKQVFIAPNSFEPDKSFDNLEQLEIIRFDDLFFQGIEGYNRLMLDINFYKTFTDYKYMLICQSDAYLFGTTSIEEWCQKDYDYIGAPWLKPTKMKKSIIYKIILKYFSPIYPKKKKKIHECYNTVGNGGLSLRKIKTFINILKNSETSDILSTYLHKSNDDPFYNEDVFWAVEGPRFFKHFSKPSWKKALAFSIEMYPKYSYKLLGDKLPFGCHAPLVHETKFWKQFIPCIPIL